MDVKTKIKAVLTGDIIGSSKLNPSRRRDLYEIFPKLSRLLLMQYPSEISYPISNFRGDSWQLIVNRPEKSFEISLFIRTFIRFMFAEEKLDTRIAIGLGETSFIPAENISAGDGPAYVTSGHLLEALTTNHMSIGFANHSSNLVELGAESIILLMDIIVTSWGTSQCQAVFLALQFSKQKEIATNWSPKPIKQASVSRSLKTAGWSQIQKSMQFFELFLAKNLEMHELGINHG